MPSGKNIRRKPKKRRLGRSQIHCKEDNKVCVCFPWTGFQEFTQQPQLLNYSLSLVFTLVSLHFPFATTVFWTIALCLHCLHRHYCLHGGFVIQLCQWGTIFIRRPVWSTEKIRTNRQCTKRALCTFEDSHTIQFWPIIVFWLGSQKSSHALLNAGRILASPVGGQECSSMLLFYSDFLSTAVVFVLYGSSLRLHTTEHLESLWRE